MGTTTKPSENIHTYTESTSKMKISSAIIIASVAANDRKVPPRTPTQRLNTLHRFMNNWVGAEIAGTINRPSRAQNMIDRGVARIEAKLTEAAGKECFFFDPALPNGGPRVQERKRRSNDWVGVELTRIQREVDGNFALDFFDLYFDSQANQSTERGISESGDVEIPSLDKQFKERLANEPNLAWKQIGTGFRKWILRYISECNGQATYQYHTNRLTRVHGKIKLAYDTVGADDYDSEDYGEENYSA